MNRQQFLEYLRDFRNLGKESLPLLKQLTEQYPYFQSAAILYLLNLTMEDHIGFEKQLRITAAYAPDRKRLKRLVHSLKQATSDVETVESEAKTEAETAAHSGEAPSEKEPPETGASQPPAEKLDLHLQDLDRVIDRLEPDRYGEDPTSYFKMIQDLIFRLEDVAKSDLVTQHESQSPREITGIRETGDYNLSHLRDKHEATGSFESKKDLIDKFLSNQPHISKPSASGFFSPDDKARSSIENQNEIVSETLARIFVEQGNYARAIKIYRKLSLLNPEKSSYFAARISKIEKEANK